MNVYDDVTKEMIGAEEKYGDFTSTHEGLGVLTEEVTELVEAVRSNIPGNVYREAVQVAAVAIRMAESMSSSRVRKRSGMGG